MTAGLLVLLGGCGDDSAPPESARPAWVVQATSQGAAPTAYAGEVRARHEPALAFRIGGKISKRFVDVGARVKKSQPLAELDASDVGLQRDAAQALLSSAEADLALATSELERYRDLVDQQLVSRSLYDARVSQHEAAQARVRQARAQADVSVNQAGYAVLRAPASGVIAQRLAEAGQVVAAGQTVFVLAEDGEREVAISVPERDARDFSVGRPLAVELWSRPGERFPGSLREISPSADPQARTFAARVSFDPGDTPVDLGQSARVYANGGDQPVVTVPLSAVHEKDGGAALWVVDPADSSVHLRPVVLGAYGEDRVPVLEGLAAGDWVVAAGVHLLLDGQRITPIDDQNRPVDVAPPAPDADAR
ncbi:resistance-nodulation-cell division (RND) efflux membrane fusion protein [Arenimonas soli]|uniref:Resistance-nodulation-cell division (RND) efflux membrane fusion protein n=1 Tax=Arenimonas soli TaxID=2269504 RepID=A0ABQ1HRC6_9GAMM|nr:resistance-nodulation-cell division (RND) efflux membrane fusion protein [Arenimonas soli]